jgi:hypothetical protein
MIRSGSVCAEPRALPDLWSASAGSDKQKERSSFVIGQNGPVFNVRITAGDLDGPPH